MLPLNIAILWHFHQPYYKKEGEYILPWVRLHGVKDYFDLPLLFNEYPKLKHTINLVPSLLMQIDDYINGSTIDKIQKLTLKDPKNLSNNDKSEIIRLFFLCNIDNMMAPYQRFNELYNKAKDRENFIKYAIEQEWMDLQTWYNLTWFGYFSRKKESIRKLFEKGANFSTEDKKLCIDEQFKVLENIKPLLKISALKNQVELSCSPMYHPILPLLCNSEAAKETMPNLPMPNPIFRFPEDALSQIIQAKEYVNSNYGINVKGMWPSEGSISDESLKLIAEADFKWAASDEEILSNSLKGNYRQTDKYFPRKIKIDGKEIAMLFRDHQLSDAIGFTYSRWNHFDAVNDFCHRLRNIKSEIINNYGENALNSAVVPIILDGENCWEYYKENGVPFCRELFSQLSNEYDFRSLTFSEAIETSRINYLPEINNLKAGSWINANFDIWIGEEEDRIAWAFLAIARKRIEEKKNLISKEKYQTALNLIFIAEGSDWFWWYGSRHNVENKDDFDVLFRWYLEQVYLTIDEKVPEELFFPIGDVKNIKFQKKAQSILNLSINGKLSNLENWKNAGIIELDKSLAEMHQVGEILKSMRYGETDNMIGFAFEFKEKINTNSQINLHLIQPIETTFTFENKKFTCFSKNNIHIEKIEYVNDEIIELLISKKNLMQFLIETNSNLKFTITTNTVRTNIIYPRQGYFEMEIRK